MEEVEVVSREQEEVEKPKENSASPTGEKGKEKIPQKSQLLICEALAILEGKKRTSTWSADEVETVLEVVLARKPWKKYAGKTIAEVWEEIVEEMSLETFQCYKGFPLSHMLTHAAHTNTTRTHARTHIHTHTHARARARTHARTHTHIFTPKFSTDSGKLPKAHSVQLRIQSAITAFAPVLKMEGVETGGKRYNDGKWEPTINFLTEICGAIERYKEEQTSSTKTLRQQKVFITISHVSL
jgi:hypothetical protein